MNNKGQALVEFVLILPIFIFLIFIIYDFGKIYNHKNSLENKCSDIISIFKTNKDINKVNNLYKDISVNITNDNEYYNIVCQKEINITTPGLNRILGNPYIINIERYIPYE